MLGTTGDAMKALLRADPSVTSADRMRILATIRNHGKTPTLPPAVTEKRIFNRAEVARRFDRSLLSLSLQLSLDIGKLGALAFNL